MTTSRAPLPLFSRNDVNGFWALFADNLANMIIVSALSVAVLGIPEAVVFGRILPGLGVALIAGLSFYAWQARRLAARTGRQDVTALPYGISTPILFVYLFLIMKPAQEAGLAAGLSPAEAGMQAWRIGIAAAFLGGILEALGSVIGPWLRAHLPRAGMLGTLAGIALVWIATVPLAEIFEHPLIGFASMGVIFLGLVALYRLPLGIPAGLAAIALGTLIGFATGDASLSFDGIGFYAPIPVVGDLFEGLRLLFANPWVLAVVIPAEIYNFIETMNNVESAEAAGDRYPLRAAQIMDGCGTMLGALFGSAFPTTVYIGHPGYKRMGAGAGYALGVGVVFFFGATFGLVAFLYELVPVAAVAPMLVFVGVVITGQAFQASPARHAMAVAVAMIPHVSNLLISKSMSLSKVLTGNPGALFAPDTVSALKMEGAHVLGHSALFNGSIIIGLLWGSMVAFLLDGEPRKALVVVLGSALLTATGIIHSSLMGFQTSEVLWGYLILGALFLVIDITGARQGAVDEG